jgi:hypothetical protein
MWKIILIQGRVTQNSMNKGKINMGLETRDSVATAFVWARLFFGTSNKNVAIALENVYTLWV